MFFCVGGGSILYTVDESKGGRSGYYHATFFSSILFTTSAKKMKGTNKP